MLQRKRNAARQSISKIGKYVARYRLLLYRDSVESDLQVLGSCLLFLCVPLYQTGLNKSRERDKGRRIAVLKCVPKK